MTEAEYHVKILEIFRNDLELRSKKKDIDEEVVIARALVNTLDFAIDFIKQRTNTERMI